MATTATHEQHWFDTYARVALTAEVFHPMAMQPRERRVRAAFGIRFDQLRDYNILRNPELARFGVLPLIEQAFAVEAVTIEPIPTSRTAAVRRANRWAAAYAYPAKGEAGEVEAGSNRRGTFRGDVRADEATKRSVTVDRRHIGGTPGGEQR